ncbi:uncharacterized protein LOC132554406 [Ylistrum balloti]|uniref:uncharacterized protein LOC132554406 n=1 Tax=Ylistrum balloti TaxID=509963 RepID=UPI002905E9F9|nr:uncharacterized protein LOC132554406 [Ylistrum balloti]
MTGEMYLEMLVILSWVGDALTGSCFPALDWCTRCDDITLNCIDVNLACLTVNHTFRFAAISNFTKAVHFQNGATLGILGVETQTQFDHFCGRNNMHIHSVHYLDQLCFQEREITKGVSETSTSDEDGADTEDVSDFIGYIVWGGVACGVLVVFLVAVLALMLRRKQQSHRDTNNSTR